MRSGTAPSTIATRAPLGPRNEQRHQKGSMFTVHRASTDVDWLQATALLYDYIEWIRSWTDIDPLAAQPQLRADLDALAGHYATEDAALYFAAWHAIAIGIVAIRSQPDGTAELKRTYVRPIARGHDIADRLIDVDRRRKRAAVPHGVARDGPWCHGPGDRGVPAQRLRRRIRRGRRPSSTASSSWNAHSAWRPDAHDHSADASARSTRLQLVLISLGAKFGRR